jgi:hypothetical protein
VEVLVGSGLVEVVGAGVVEVVGAGVVEVVGAGVVEVVGAGVVGCGVVEVVGWGVVEVVVLSQSCRSVIFNALPMPPDPYSINIHSPVITPTCWYMYLPLPVYAIAFTTPSIVN